jgi:pimeloyl-ACP methyl ester carboxylesterase
LGGWIALLTARYAPQRVKKLFLLYPGGIVTLKTSFFLQAFFSRFFWFWHPHFQEWNMLARFIWPHHPQINELIRRIFKHYYSKPVPPLPILSPRDLQQINAPVAILIGDHDEMFDPQYSLVRAQLMPGFAYGQIVPNAGHGMSVSHTDLVHEQVIQFLLGDS